MRIDKKKHMFNFDFILLSMKNKNIQLISKTSNGRIYICSSCANIHIEYKNLSFSFTKEEYDSFKKYFSTIDGEYWESRNKDSFHDRKIQIPIGHKNFKIAMNSIEVYELKVLLSDEKSGENRFDLLGSHALEMISVN